MPKPLQITVSLLLLHLPLSDGRQVAVWTGFEPATPCVTGMYSNQLNYQTNGAKDGIRTRDPNLGKVVLYQLSYFRNLCIVCTV